MADETSTSGTETGEATDEFDAVEAMGSLLDDDGDMLETAEPAKKKKPATLSDDDDDDDEEVDLEDDDEDDEQEEVEEEDAADEDVEDDADEDEEGVERIPVKIDGKVQELTLDELKKHASLGAAATKRLDEAAEIRKTADAERTAIAQERAQLAEQFKALSELQAKADPEPDWDELMKTDPMEFAYQRAVWDRKAQERGRLQSVQQELLSRNAREQQDAFAKQLTAEREKLYETIPAWKDEAKAKKDMGLIRKYGIELGFSEDELDQVYDHRAVKALRDAARYQKLMKQKGQLLTEARLEKQAGQKSKVSKSKKPLTPSSGRKVGKGQKMAEAMQKVRSSGDVRDAAAAIAQMGLID